MLARIYKPAKTSMQSGRANTKEWILEFELDAARRIDPLMGWTSVSDTQGQVQLKFATREEAVAFATKHKIPHQVFEPRERKRVLKSYADNFKYGRIGSWTH